MYVFKDIFVISYLFRFRFKNVGVQNAVPIIRCLYFFEPTDSSCISMVTYCTSIILTYSYFSLEKKTKIAFINGNCDSFFFFTLRVVQTAIQLKNKYIADCTTRNYIFCTFYITGCTTRNIICNVFKKNSKCIAGCTTPNVFKKSFVLWVDKPAAVV